ncbi:MAG: DNA-binding protein [Bacteroidetes bacterium]|nr:DNA-binding protein [Bacteroidota bacterium]
MEQQIILNVSKEELRQLIVEVFREASEVKQLTQRLKDATERLLTRKEVAALLKVSLPTLRQYVKDGLIQSHRIGRRVLFKANDVESALTAVKMQKFKRRD